ncbi:hypothetical protein N0B40_04595 [Chryseobacterium oranimense]|uniref:hypothetical protein n=1 Tax=Chryseobacterium oranimense TaxID=421058 RepID=UPI0021AEF5FD|nr:hypothetical protein [Chryseobacterium oranimense]UWX61558.1 hypothetical protein N0B40_04595 [Chryseobacterium oranimense]
MKKFFFIGTLALSTFTFANNKIEVKESKEVVKQEIKPEVKELTLEQQKALAYFIWYSVSFPNACGDISTVFFQSNYADGSPAFNRELAFAVNDGYANC